jgi:hypothetical protein
MQRALRNYVYIVAGLGGLLTVWAVAVTQAGGRTVRKTVRLGVNPDGERSADLERGASGVLNVQPPSSANVSRREDLQQILDGAARDALHRELAHAGLLQEGASYSARLLACVVVTS